MHTRARCAAAVERRDLLHASARTDLKDTMAGGKNLVSNVAHRAIPFISCGQEDKVTALQSRLVVAAETGKGVCGEEAGIQESCVWDNGDVCVQCSNSCN